METDYRKLGLVLIGFGLGILFAVCLIINAPGEAVCDRCPVAKESAN